jgi:hypothetical protein
MAEQDIVLDFSAFQCKWAYPSACGMDYNRIAELYESGEIGGVIGRLARGKFPDARFPEFHAELGSRGVPMAGYGVFNPYQVVQDQVATFKAMEAQYPLKFVGKIKRAGDVEIPLPGMSQVVYATLTHQYLVGINADTIYSAKYIWEQVIGSQADGWHGKFQKWAANYTTASKPALPKGWTDYLLWQFEADGNFKGAYYGVGSNHIDLNRWNPAFAPPPPDPDPIPDPGDDCEPRPGKILKDAWLRTKTQVTLTHPPTGTRIVVLKAGTPVMVIREVPPAGGYDWLLLFVPSLGLYGVTAKHLVEVE